jgi:hypothetical protein
MRNKLLALILSLALVCPSWAAMEFDGSNDYVQLPTISPAGEKAFSVWVKPSADGDVILYLASGSSTDNFILGTHWNVPNRILANTRNSATGAKTTPAIVNLGTWMHIVVNKTTGGITAIYINGNDVTESTTAWWAPGTNNYRIGQRDSGTPRPFEGQMDDVRIYNRQLSAAEIQSLYLSRSRLNITDGLIGWWPLDQGDDGATALTTPSALDISGSGNHGTPTNSPVWRASEWINYP